MIWNKEIIQEYINKWKEEDIYECKRKQEKSIRTYAQVKYYFGVILKYICAEIWLSHQFEVMEQHKQIKDYFWLETTVDLSTKEFSYMCEEIRAWYLENRNLYIPLPREDEELKDLQKYLY